MAKSKLTADQYEEELNRQTTDLNAKRHELDDILAMAELYHKTIEENERDLIIKDARLKAAKEKNQAELWQLSMELSSTQEGLQHELNFHQSDVSSISNAKQRYLDLYHENQRLKNSIDELESLYQKEIHGHASQLHNMNKERKDLRKNMEDKLRKDLSGLEIAFQQQAFDALMDSQKLAMFENAKLKDEVAMQGVGITNLTGRLAKQRKACRKCRSYLNKYHQKAERLREQLAIVTSRKNDIAKRKKELDDEEARLLEQSQTIYQKYCVQSSDEQVTRAEATVHEYIQAMREFRGQEAMLAAWKERYRLLQALHIELKPTTKDEKYGLYSEKLFPIYPIMQSFQNINEQNPWISIEEYLYGSGDNTVNNATNDNTVRTTVTPQSRRNTFNNAAANPSSQVSHAAKSSSSFAAATGNSKSSSSPPKSPPTGLTALQMPDAISSSATAKQKTNTVEGNKKDGLAKEEEVEAGEDSELGDDDGTNSVSSATSQSGFTLQSQSVKTEATSVGAQRRRLSRLKMASANIFHAIQSEDGLAEALSVLQGKEKRMVGFIQLACEKEKAKLRRSKRQELKESKRQQRLSAMGGGGVASPGSGSRPGTAPAVSTATEEEGEADEDGEGAGGGKEPFEGQNMVSWAVMRIVHIWALTRPTRIPDADLQTLTADSLNLLPKPITTTSTSDLAAGASLGMSSSTSTMPSFMGDGSSPASYPMSMQHLNRSSPQDRRLAMNQGQQTLLTPQQISDHHFHQDVLRQLEEDKRQGLILQEDRPLIGSSGSGLAHFEHDDFSVGSDSSSLSHIEEEEDEDDFDEDDEEGKVNQEENKEGGSNKGLKKKKNSDFPEISAENVKQLEGTENNTNLKNEDVKKRRSRADMVGIRGSMSSVLSIQSTESNDDQASDKQLLALRSTSSRSLHNLLAAGKANEYTPAVAAAEMLYIDGVDNDVLKAALRREAEIASMEKERMEEELLSALQQPKAISMFTPEEIDAQLALDEAMDAFHQRNQQEEEEEAEEGEDGQDADRLLLDDTGSESQAGGSSHTITDVRYRVNLKKKRAWLHAPPAFVPNPFTQQQQKALFALKQPSDIVTGGIHVHNKEAYAIGPPLLLRNHALAMAGEPASSSSSSGNQKNKLRVSLSAGRLLHSPHVASPLSTNFMSQNHNGGLFGDSFRNNQQASSAIDTHSYVEEKVMTNAELRASDPLLHKPRRKLPGISTVPVSPKVLQQLPRSVSTPMVALQAQQQEERGNSTAPLKNNNFGGSGITTNNNNNQLGGIAMPQKKHKLAASTGALPRYR